MRTKIKIHHIGIGVLLTIFFVAATCINFSNIKIAKAVAPTLLELKYMDSGAGDGRVDLIRMMFSGAITSCTATVADFGYTANDITGSSISGGTVHCAGDDLYVWIDLGTAGDVAKTSHSTAPTLTYTDDAARTISGTGGEVSNFGPQNISDGTGPWPTAISMQDNSGDGIVDRAVFTYSEALVDHAPGTLGFDATSSSNHGSCTGESADPDGTTTLVVTFTCTNVYTQVGDLSINAAGANDLHDAAANELPYKTYTSASSPAIADGVKPAISTAVTGDTNSDGSVDSLVITFSEQVDVTDSGTDNDFTLAASSGTATITAGTYTAADTTTLTYVITTSVTGNTSLTVNPSYSTAGAGSIIDNGSNEMLELATVTGTDGAKPAVITAATGDNDSNGTIDRLALTFSEQVDVTDGGTDNDFTLAASSGTATITAGTYTAADTTTLTYVITTSVTGNTSLTVSPSYSTAGAGSIKDNSLNEMATGETVAGTDGAKPIIKQFNYKDLDSDGKIDTFAVTFTETVTDTSFLSANDLNLTSTGGIAMMEFGSNGSDLITGSVSSVDVTLGSEGGTANTASGISFAISTQNGFFLTDGTNTNTTLGAQSQATFVDEASPRITFFYYNDADSDGKIDSFSITFSESVTPSSVLKASNLTFTNVGDFTGAAFGSAELDVIAGTVSSATVTLGTEATVVDTVNAGTITISTQGSGFSLIDSIGNTNSTTGAQSQATFADGAGPIITSAVMSDASLNDGKIDKIALTYSENLDMMPGAGTNGFVISSASNHGSCGAASSDPDGTTTLNVTFSCANAHTAVGDLTLIYTSNSNIMDGSNNAPSATLTASSTTPTAIIDDAKPILVSATKSQNPISSKDELTLVYSEPMYVDINSGTEDTSGVIDAGDTTSSESMTSTAGIGAIVNGTTLTQIGGFSVDGTIVQSAATSNTIAVAANGLTITITLNSVAGSYFSTSGVAPSGTFTPTDTVTAPCILAQAPSATTLTQRLNSSASAPTSSGSWDLTPPNQITGFSTGTTGNGNIPLLWSAITAPSDFQGFHVYYKTSASVTYSNGTLWSSTNDIALRTSTTAGTDVTDLTVGNLYYFIIHAIDKAGNFSTASSEISANATAQGRVYVETTPPAIPTEIKVEYINGKAVLTWTDPTVSDLALIEILRGKNEIPVSGDLYSSVNKGVQTYTDKDAELKAGDITKYILRSKDTNGNRSVNSGTVTVTIPVPQTSSGIQNQQVQNPLTTEEKKITDDGIAALEESIKTIDKVLGLYNIQIKKLSINKTKNKTKIAQIKSVVRRIEKNKAKQVLKLNELKAKAGIKQ